jgi:hypothetical protein
LVGWSGRILFVLPPQGSVFSLLVIPPDLHEKLTSPEDVKFLK